MKIKMCLACYVLGVVSLAIVYAIWIAEDVKIPSEIGCKIVNCHEEKIK